MLGSRKQWRFLGILRVSETLRVSGIWYAVGALLFTLFFFSVGELTITLEDVVNNFLLPVFGNENRFDISLSKEDLEVENKLFSHFGGRTASPGGKPAGMGRWVMTLSREKDKEVN